MSNTLGAPFRKLTANNEKLSSKTSGSAYAVAVVNGSAVVDLITDSRSDDLNGVELADGFVFSYNPGFVEIEKISGDGTVVCYLKNGA